MFVPVAAGGPSVAAWTPGHPAQIFWRIEAALKRLTRIELKFTHLLWHQGESDQDSTGEKYKKSFLLMYRAIRKLGIKAPMYIALATYCNGYGNEDVKNAQAYLAETNPLIHVGADTDAITSDRFRIDKCHFNEFGRDWVANLWYASLIN